MKLVAACPSPVGILTLAARDNRLTGLWIAEQKYHGAGLSADTVRRDDLPVFDTVRRWLDRYFAGEKPDPAELPLAPEGSAFRQAVWTILLEIPYGRLTTYGEIAAKVAARTGRTSMSGQAVGGAVGHNPISIIIPCHRVVGADGSLTGYASGLATKIRLLENEGVATARLYLPRKSTAP